MSTVLESIYAHDPRIHWSQPDDGSPLDVSALIWPDRVRDHGSFVVQELSAGGFITELAVVVEPPYDTQRSAVFDTVDEAIEDRLGPPLTTYYRLDVYSVSAAELTNPLNTDEEVYVTTCTFVDEDDVYARDAAQAAMRDYDAGHSGMLHLVDDGTERFVGIVESMPKPGTYQQMLVPPHAVDSVRQLAIEHPDGQDGRLLAVSPDTGYGHAMVLNEFVEAAAQFGAVVEY